MPYRYFLRLAYNGSSFHGWQIQPNAHSVQQCLTDALRVLLREDISLTGCGRTDTGVHAHEYYAHFDIQNELEEPENLIYKINSILPHDIVVYNIYQVSAEAHARFSAISRTYKYYINSLRDPFMLPFEYVYSMPADVVVMNIACEILLINSNFGCFTKAHSGINNTLCQLTEAKWEIIGSRLIFTISANRFLRNMVRAIVGTMLDIGRKKMSFQEFENLFIKGNRSDAGYSVPAKGLILERVKYPEDITNQLV